MIITVSAKQEFWIEIQFDCWFWANTGGDDLGIPWSGDGWNQEIPFFRRPKHNWLVVTGTFFIFPNSWDDDPIWLSYFSGGLKPHKDWKMKCSDASQTGCCKELQFSLFAAMISCDAFMTEDFRWFETWVGDKKISSCGFGWLGSTLERQWVRGISL